MKKIKRIISVMFLIVVILLVGYMVHTCSRTVEILEEQREVVYEED